MDETMPISLSTCVESPLTEPVPAEGVGYREALLSRSFVMLAAAAGLFAAVIYAITVHLVPILIWNGIGPTMAAALMRLAGVSAMAGRLLGGALLDRFPRASSARSPFCSRSRALRSCFTRARRCRCRSRRSS